MRAACRLAREVLDSAGAAASVPGTTTQRLDDLVAGMCFSRGAYPSPLNYRGFPKSVCTSVNNVACHGIPDDRPLKVLFIQSCVKGRFSSSYFEQEGDIINVDVTVYLDGVHGDCSETYAVGTVDGNATRLMSATKDCLDQAITLCGPGMEFRAIGELIEKLAAKKHGFRLGERFFKSKVFFENVPFLQRHRCLYRARHRLLLPRPTRHLPRSQQLPRGHATRDDIHHRANSLRGVAKIRGAFILKFEF